MTKPLPFGKYLLLDRLNVGGMAEVFVAKVFGELGAERILALKRILPSLVSDREFVSMFLDEARIAAQLHHPNIVQIFELGREEADYFIAMEYLQGCDLRVAVERARKCNRPLPMEGVLRIVGEVAAGLDHAHRAKDQLQNDLRIVHRDVSPQNVMISYGGAVKLIDFGIAKVATRQQQTQAGILKGKFGYMSPEQARGSPVDRRSDLFALGVIFHELLTGRRLFVGETDFAVLERVRNADVVAPRQYDRAIPEEVERIVLKALARDPDDRYQWASDLSHDLEAFRGRESEASSSAAVRSAGSSIQVETEALSGWMQGVCADGWRLENERMLSFLAVRRPAFVPLAAVERFTSRHAFSRQEATTEVIPTGFELAETSLLTGLPEGLSVTEVAPLPRPLPQDRWEAPTKPPLPAGAIPLSKAAQRLPPWMSRHPLGTWGLAGLCLTASLFAAEVVVRRALSSTGAVIITARPSAGVLVEVDTHPVTLSNQGIGVVRGLSPGNHLVSAKGPSGGRALWVTVTADEITTIDLAVLHPEELDSSGALGP